MSLISYCDGSKLRCFIGFVNISLSHRVILSWLFMLRKLLYFVGGYSNEIFLSSFGPDTSNN